MIRVVADTDVLVAGFIGPSGSPADVLLEAHREGEFELVTSPRLIAELDGVLRRPVFANHADERRAAVFVDQLTASTLFVADIYDPPRVTIDRTGDFLAAIARTAGARYVISGDESLRSSHVKDLTVLSATEFVTALDRAEAMRV